LVTLVYHNTDKNVCYIKITMTTTSSNFTPKSPLPVNPSAKRVFQSFSPQNHKFVLKIIKSILSLTDFSPDGKIQYKLQSTPGQLLINEKALLDKLNVEGFFSYYGSDEHLGIVTLGNINVNSLGMLELFLLKATQQFKLKEKTKETKKTKTTVITIKNVRLDEKNYYLEINNGEKIIAFKSRKKGKGFEKETKQFKTLHHLWDFRRELKADKVFINGDFVSLENLAKVSGSKSAGAAYKHIQRLNTRFENEGVAIKISGENEKYRLIINKA